MSRPCRAEVTTIDLCPDPSRVLAKPFVPGLEDVGPTGSRAAPVIDRVLHLTDAEVEGCLDELRERFTSRHRDIEGTWLTHAARVTPLIDTSMTLSLQRRLLLGAYFTHEYSVEGAALANPSIVPFPAPSPDGTQEFVMSVRCIGEGHRSAIGFRTGSVGSSGSVTIDPPSPFLEYQTGIPGMHSRRVFHSRLDEWGHDIDEVAHLLSLLPPEFDDTHLSAALATLAARSPRPGPEMTERAMELSRWSYRVQFADSTDISERLLWPHSPPEYHGMEDARFVLFEDHDGDSTYLATYTAFDRNRISVQLLQTDDFRTFSISPMAGTAATGKGLALFPRRIGDRFAALTRSDRETNGLAMSDDIRHWETHEQLQVPHEAWELTQLGNCGSPLETPEGWLVITHGVGAMRTYRIGALLLDLDHPVKVIGRTVEPILEPLDGRVDGYVPNVVYSCGSMIHDDVLIMPFGIADQRIGVATLAVADLLAAMS